MVGHTLVAGGCRLNAIDNRRRSSDFVSAMTLNQRILSWREYRCHVGEDVDASAAGDVIAIRLVSRGPRSLP
jgi:hypothetical protein